MTSLARIALPLVIAAAAIGLRTPALAEVAPVATYLFQDTLAAREPGAPALVSVNPLGGNGFETATVSGQSRRVFRWDGNTSGAQQAGLTLATTGLIAATSYSVELVLEFRERAGGYRRIVDVENRASDNGFYVDPSNRLNVFPVASGSATFSNDVFHHVVLTTAGGTVKAYLDGVLQFTVSTSIMNIANPGSLMQFFLDNTSGGGQGEFSDGRVALIRLWPAALPDADVASLAADPFDGTTGPELALAMSDGPDPIRAGNTLTYEVSVANEGAEAATGVVVTDALPPEVAFLSAVASQGECVEASGVVTCHLGDITAGGGAGVTIRVRPTMTGTVANAVHATSVEGESVSASALTSVPAPPAPPADLTASVGPDGRVVLVWRDGSDSESGFQIERRGRGRFSRIVTVPANATTYVDASAGRGQTYTYRVRAINVAGVSAFSGEATVTVLVPRLVVRQRTLSLRARVGSAGTRNLVIRNDGSAPATGSVGGLPAPFAVVAGGGDFVLAPGESHVVTVRFAPAATGSFSAALAITTPGPASAREVQVRGAAR